MRVDQEKIPDWLNAATHFGTTDFVSNPWPAYGEKITIGLRLPENAPVTEVILRTLPNGEQQFNAMAPGEVKEGWQTWQAELTIREPRTVYRFALVTQEKVWWKNALEVSEYPGLDYFDYKILAGQERLKWLEESVFYQIFPDRFADGDPNNNPRGETIPGTEITRDTYPWGQAHPYSRTHFPFWGGDLLGIEQHLDYLQALGVNAIYLNPIFSAWTDHRYDTFDYRQVDPTLGGNQALASLSRALRHRGMRYLLDIVPNHAGLFHPWFAKAREDAQSPEAGYFYIDPETREYATWMGARMLPKLNYRSQALREEMYAGDAAVMRHWLGEPYLADGWRVDVGNMLGRNDKDQLADEILPAMRAAVKQKNPQAYLLGENFFDASSQLQGNAWDGVMNYTGFANSLLHWLRPYEAGALGWKKAVKAQDTWSTATLLRAWQENLALIPWTVALQQFNLLDSHDTPRLATILGGDQDLIRLALIVLFTFPGVPCVYYGDEIGLVNEGTFGSRNCMPWDESTWDKELLGFYQQLIALRRADPVLQSGAFQMLYAEDDLIVFERVLDGVRVLVSASKGAQVRPAEVVKISGNGMKPVREFIGKFTGLRLWLDGDRLTLPGLPRGGEIWQAA